jgi:serine/threonine protein kinase
MQIDKFFGSYIHDNAVMSYPRCDRFGEIQSLKTKKDGIYRLIMAAKLGKHTVKMDTVSVECRIMNSLADFELYDGANFELETALSPIIDPYDQNREQVYFHITTAGKHNYVTKILKFDSFRDVKLKEGIYEISLHQSMSRSQLVDHFIMSRGTMNALVMIFKYFETSLLDIMQYRKQAQGYGWNEQETMYIWMKIIKGYRELRENNIYHRDIRLSNIFYTPANTN